MIYTITTVQISLKPNFSVEKSRTWFYFFDFEKAKEFVINNTSDLAERGYWPYVVIEKVNEGISYSTREEYWFKFNHQSEKFEQCNKPAKVKSIVCFGIG